MTAGLDVALHVAVAAAVLFLVAALIGAWLAWPGAGR